ncbi:hypothetical protein LTR29_018327, partial [Friedmanniomyces endolithicus]
MHRQRHEALFPLGGPDLDRAVPATTREAALVHQAPVHGEDLAAVLLPARDGELADADVEELEAAVAAG